jgi:antitoxin (DNA-binding transcriptional repressor) of toxin-antitoxin stability system
MAEGVAAEYQAVIDEVEAGEDLTVAARRRVVARLRRELHRIEQRDYFPPPERARAKRAVNGLAAALEPV